MIVRAIKTAPTFTADYWIKNGGAALAVDPDPNVTPPAPAREMRQPARIISMRSNNTATAPAGPHVAFFPIGGTSVSLRIWFKEDANNLWIPFTAGFAILPTTPQQLSHAMMPGSRLFIQVTANTGMTAIACVYK